MNFATKFRVKQTAVLIMVGITALLAIVPKEWAERLNLDTDLLIGILGVLVVLALFVFARFSYFLLTVLLIVGANIPDRWAMDLHIDKLPLLFALGLMIAISVLNQLSKLLPSGLGPKPKSRNPDGVHALMMAASRGQDRIVKSLIDMNIDLNCVDEIGLTPLMIAAAGGHGKVVEMLIEAGADVEIKNSDGLTAMNLATELGQGAATESIQEALVKARTRASAPEPPNTWRARDRRSWF